MRSSPFAFNATTVDALCFASRWISEGCWSVEAIRERITGRWSLVDDKESDLFSDYCCTTNSFHSEDEETDGEFPFLRGRLFKLAFGLGDEAFIVAVDGQYFTYYNYPSPSLAISSLKCYTAEHSDLTVRRLEYHADSPLLPRVEKLSLL